MPKPVWFILAFYLLPGIVCAQCLSSWKYYRPITIINNTSTKLTDFQVKVIINTASPIAAGKMNSNGDDIRFLDSGECSTTMPYYIESGINTSATSIWIKMPVLPANAHRRIRMYYGNSSASAASSGTNTFLLFEDFLGSSLSSTAWSTFGSLSSYSVSSGQISISSGSGSTVGSRLFISTQAFQPPIVTEGLVTSTSGFYTEVGQVDSGTYTGYSLNYGGSTAGSNAGMDIGQNYSNSGSMAFKIQTKTTSPGTLTGIWYSAWPSTSVQIGKWPGGSLNTTTSSLTLASSVQVFFGNAWTSIGSSTYDWVRARKYASKEATFAFDSAVPNVFKAAFTYKNQCVGALTSFSDSSYYYPDGWYWDFGDANASKDTSYSKNPTHTFSKSGTYKVKLVSNSDSTKDSITNTITIYSLPTKVTTSTKTVCYGDSLALSAATGAGGLTYAWSNGKYLSDSTAVSTYAYPYTNTTFTVNVSNANGCIITDTFIVKVDTTCKFTKISGVINNYSAVLSYDTCYNSLTLDTASFYKTGSKALLIEMQGAVVDSTNTSNFGTIKSYGNAGNYEYVTIDSISGKTVYLKYKLVKSYDIKGKMQLVTVPSYTGHVQVSKQLTSQPWNGTKGGVVIFEATGNLLLNSDIDASGKGFRGGNVINDSLGCVNDSAWYMASATNHNGGRKGEGIAILSSGKDAGKGPNANGAGGGGQTNSAGGGGGNAGAGGIGGNSWNGCLYPNNGKGGYGLTYNSTQNRIFLGGGGGAGQENDKVGTDGTNGGGIIMIRANNVITASGNIYSKGLTQSKVANIDGAGGAGAGGVIAIAANGYRGSVALTAGGGKGGDNNSSNQSGTSHGPGGGGGGGAVWLSGSKVTGNFKTNIKPGDAGNIVNTNSPNYPGHYGADSGRIGQVLSGFSIPQSKTIFTRPYIAISSQPASVSACPGSNISFSVIASGTSSGTLTYQWQENKGSSWANLSNTGIYSNVTKSTLNLTGVSSTQDGYKYRVIISKGCAKQDTSNAAVFTIGSAPTISTQPVSQTICAGSGTSFKMAASGTSLTVKWQYNTGSGWTDVTNGGIYSGAAKDTLTLVSSSSSLDSIQYRCVLNGCSTIYSNTVVLRVNSITAASVNNLTVCDGANAAMAVTVSSTGPGSITYQWKVSKDGGKTFSTISGATQSVYKQSAVNYTVDNYQYECLVSIGGCTAFTSSAGTLRVNAVTSATINNSPITICKGSDATFKTSVSRYGPDQAAYKWYVSKDGGKTFDSIAGAKLSLYTESAAGYAADSWLYKYTVTLGSCPAYTSDTGHIHVVGVQSATVSDITVCSGNNAVFSVSYVASKYFTVGFQWQLSTNGGGSFNNITGATASSYTVSAPDTTYNGYQYRCIVNPGNSCPSFTSSAGTLHVNSPPVIKKQPSSASIYSGCNIAFSVTASGTALTYQWQINTGSGWNNVSNTGNYSGASTNTLSVTSALQSQNGYKFRVIIKGTCLPQDTSNVVTLTVNPVKLITPASKYICQGDSAKLTASVNDLKSLYWSPGTGLADSTATSVWVKPSLATRYTVHALTNAGCSVQDTARVNIYPLKPKTPVILNTTVLTTGTIQLKMQDSSAINIDSFIIYRAVDNGSYTRLKSFHATANNAIYTITDNVSADQHSYRYYTVVKDSCGKQSDSSSYHKPVLLTGTAGELQAKLNWIKYAGYTADSVVVQRLKLAGNQYVWSRLAKVNTTDITYTDNSYTNCSTPVYYRIVTYGNKQVSYSDTLKLSPFDTVAPARVNIRTATVINGGLLNLQFDKVSKFNTRKYLLYVQKNRGGYVLTDSVLAKNISGSTYTWPYAVSALKDTFSFRVYALDTCGNISAATETHRDIQLNGQAADYATHLQWSKYQGFTVSKYTVQQNIGGVWTDYKILGATDSFYIDTLIPCKVTRYYRIKAQENGGDASTAYSDSIALTPFDTIKPERPLINYVTDPDNASVQINWAKSTSPDVRAYIIYRQNNLGVWVKIDSVGDVSTYTDNNTSTALSHCYAVQAKDSCAENVSALSLPHCNIALSTAVKGCEKSIYLSWNSYSGWAGIDKYDIYRTVKGGTENLIASVSGSTTAFKDSMLSFHNKYCYRIEASYAMPGINLHSYSNQACNQTFFVDTPAVLTATKLVTSTTAGIVVVRWKSIAKPHLDYNRLYYSANGTSFSLLKDSIPAAQDTFAHTGINTETADHYYYLVTMDSCGTASEKSAAHKTMDLTVSVGQLLHKLNWTPYKGFTIKKYYIQKLFAGFKTIDSVPGTDTSSRYFPAPCNSVERYRIIAIGYNTGEVSYSDTMGRQAIDTEPSNRAIINNATVISGNNIRITYRGSDSLDTYDYIVQRAVNGVWGTAGQVLFNGPGIPITYVDTVNTQAAQYCYTVIVRDSCLNATLTDTFCAINLKGLAQNLGDSLKWNKFKGYNINKYYIITYKSGTWDTLAAEPNNIINYLHAPLPCKVPVTYKIAGYENGGSRITLSDSITLVPFDTTRPPAPKITYATVLNGSQIQLAWTPSVPKVKLYEVSMKTGKGPWNVIATLTNQQQYTVTGLNTPDSIYDFRITAIDSCAANRSYYSVVHSPVQLDGKGQNLSNLLTWKAYEGWAGVSKYYIYQWKNTWQLLDSVSGSTLTYLQKNLPCNVPQYYRIGALDNTGKILTNSDTIQLVPFDTIKPPAPTIKYATVLNGTSIQLFWNRSIPKVKQYELSLKTGKGAWNVVTVVNIDTQYTFTGLNTLDSIYDFRIVAIDSCAANRSQNSMFHSPVQLDGKGQNLSNLLTWKAYEGWGSVQKYYIYVWKNKWTLLDSVSGNTLKYLHTGLSCNVPQTYKVSALEASGKYLSYSDSIQLTPFDTIKPPAPVAKYATVLNGTQIQLFWHKSISKVKDYELSLKTGSGTWNLVTTVHIDSQYTFTGLNTQDSVYDFRIVAVDTCANNHSPNSQFHSPVQLDGKALDDTVKLTWKAYEGFALVAKYYVYNYQKGAWKLLDSVNGNTLVYYHNTVPCNIWQSYKIVTKDKTGQYLSWSDSVNLQPFDTIKPKAPQLYYATVQPDQSIKLSWEWNPKSDVKYFDIFRSVDGGAASLLHTVIYDSTYTDKTTNPQKHIYAYHIEAIDSCDMNNRSPQSHQDTVMNIHLKSFACTPQIDISWNAYKGMPHQPDTYEIYRSTDKTSFTQIAALKTVPAKYTDSTVSLGQVYYYRIKATDSKSGYISYSDTLGLMPVIVPRPDSNRFVYASVLKTGVTDGQMYLEWTKANTADTNAKGYHIYQYDSATAQYKLIHTENNLAITSFIQAGIDTRYASKFRYLAATYNRCGLDGKNSAMHQPVHLEASARNLEIDLKWSAYQGMGIKEADLYKSEDGRPAYLLMKTAAKDTVYADTNISCNHVYTYQVRTLLANGKTSYSDSVSVKAFDTIPPVKTPLLLANVARTAKVSAEIQLTFHGNAVKNRAGFNIYRATATGKFTLIRFLDDTVTGVKQWLDGGLNTYDSTYRYYIRTVDSCGNEAMPSDTHQVVHVKATAFNKFIRLKWSPYIGFKKWSYQVMKKEGNGGWYVLKTDPKDSLGLTDSNITCHVLYTYMIAAVDSLGNYISYSNHDSTYGINTTPPVTKQMDRATVNSTGVANGKIFFSWQPSPSKNLQGYDIYRSTDGIVWTKIAGGWTLNNYTDSLLNTYGQSYMYRIQPFDSCGNIGAFTEIHKTINLRTVPGNQFIKVNWSAYLGWKGAIPSGKVKRYEVYKDGKWVASVGKDTLTWTDTTVICTQTYHYMVKAVCDTATDTLVSWSNTDSARAWDHNAPARVYIKTVTVSSPNKAATITWAPSASYDVKNYYIYRKTGLNGDLKFIDSTDQATYTDNISKIDTAINTDDQCYFVFARDHCGNQSPGSNEGCLIILHAENQAGYNSLKWNDYRKWADGVGSYNVYKNEDKQGWSLIGTTQAGNVNQYLDRNLTDTTIDFCYQVEAVENAGQYNQLSRSTVVCVHQDATVFIPNTFSHYLIDGLNDKFGPKGLHIKNYKMQIYNRWGELLFNTDKGEQWDGTFRGIDVPEGVYIYYITIEDYNNHSTGFKGNITIYK